jgi:hypothetical protein
LTFFGSLGHSWGSRWWWLWSPWCKSPNLCYFIYALLGKHCHGSFKQHSLPKFLGTLSTRVFNSSHFSRKNPVSSSTLFNLSFWVLFKVQRWTSWIWRVLPAPFSQSGIILTQGTEAIWRHELRFRSRYSDQTWANQSGPRSAHQDNEHYGHPSPIQKGWRFWTCRSERFSLE